MMCKLHYDDEGIVKTRGGGEGRGGGAWNWPSRKMMVYRSLPHDLNSTRGL